MVVRLIARYADDAFASADLVDRDLTDRAIILVLVLSSSYPSVHYTEG